MIIVNRNEVSINDPCSSQTGAELCTLFLTLNDLFIEHPEIIEGVWYSFIKTGCENVLSNYTQIMITAGKIAMEEIRKEVGLK